MGSQRRLAVSYSRFSCPLQAKGDSQERQDEMFRAFCQRHNLTPCSEVFADKGKSGYKDEHRKKGRLGQLVAAAKDGRFEGGSVVVVEAWDRLGRLRPDKQTDLVAELLRTGVSIGVCRLDSIGVCRLDDILKGRGRGQRQARYVNVFKSLLIHARDGEGFLLHNKGTGDNPQLILMNATGNDTRSPCYTFPYLVFETEVLNRLREVDPADVLPKKDRGPNRADVLREKLKAVRADMAGLQADLKAGYSKALATILREKEAEEEAIGKELQERSWRRPSGPPKRRGRTSRRWWT